MKRLIMGLFAAVLLCCCGCTEETAEETVKMDDLMKISTWVMDPALEGKGYWAYTDDYSRKFGYWVPAEGELTVNDKDVFREERLLPGEPRIMAPFGYNGGNLNFTIDFEGIVTVEKTEPADQSIMTSFEPNLSDQWTEEPLIKRNGPCNLNVYPIGKNPDIENWNRPLILHDTLVGKEYLLTVKGYELDGTLMVTAVLRLTALEDEVYPYEEIHKNTNKGSTGKLEKHTRFCSVELMSYEYSDDYKIMEMYE